MHIRAAAVEDSKAIARVQVDSYQTAYAGILPATYLAHFTYQEEEQDWRELIDANRGDILYVAETDEGEIVGYALGRVEEGKEVEYESELVALHVRRSYQRQGLGRRLIAAVAGQLHRQGCSSLVLWVLADNSPARAFYERLGGQQHVGERRFEVGETSVVEVAYGWDVIERLLMSEETNRWTPKK